MGKPIATAGKPAASQSYRDDPDAVSMHTTRDDYEYDEAAALPSYDDSEAMTAAESAINPAPEPAPQMVDNYTAIMQPGGSRGFKVYENKKAKNCNETTIRMEDNLTDPDALHDYIMSYLRLARPTPGVRVWGYHTETTRRDNKKETETVNDFDIMLSMAQYLPRPTPGKEDAGWSTHVADNSDKVHRGSWRATRAQGYKRDIEVGDASTPDLMTWCKDYCSSPSKLKIFRVTRDVLGIDQEYLRAQIEGIIRSTNYRGHMQVSFPIEEKHVDIYNPHIINRWRISWVRFIFYFTFLWLFTWPILFFMTKRWNVYRVNWRFSWMQNEPNGATTKKYALISEKAWFERHASLIKNLALNRFDGDATDFNEDVRTAPNNGRSNSMPQTGNRNVDSAVDLISGGVNMWNALQGRSSRTDDEGWGADQRW